MKRLAKGDGYGNVYFEDVPVPGFGPDQALIKTHTTHKRKKAGRR